jgi:hypothetical protein
VEACGSPSGRPLRFGPLLSDGLAVDRARSLSLSFQEAVSCIHSNPSWGLLKPGEKATAHGRVYLVRGALDELYERYLEDFARADE